MDEDIPLRRYNYFILKTINMGQYELKLSKMNTNIPFSQSFKKPDLKNFKDWKVLGHYI